jgi:hypothetical protein
VIIGLVISVDANEVTAKVVLAAEGPPAGVVVADMRFQPVGVVGRHVGLEVVGTGEVWKEGGRTNK